MLFPPICLTVRTLTLCELKDETVSLVRNRNLFSRPQVHLHGDNPVLFDWISSGQAAVTHFCNGSPTCFSYKHYPSTHALKAIFPSHHVRLLFFRSLYLLISSKNSMSRQIEIPIAFTDAKCYFSWGDGDFFWGGVGLRVEPEACERGKWLMRVTELPNYCEICLGGGAVFSSRPITCRRSQDRHACTQTQPSAILSPITSAISLPNYPFGMFKWKPYYGQHSCDMAPLCLTPNYSQLIKNSLDRSVFMMQKRLAP